jgi:hypothetical protein
VWNAAQGGVAGKEGRGGLHSMFYAVDVNDVMMGVDEPAMQLSDEGSVVVPLESDVEEEEGDDDDDSLGEEMEEDLGAEVMGGDVDDMVGGDDGGGGPVEVLEKCRTCCRKKNTMVEETQNHIVWSWHCTSGTGRIQKATFLFI